MVLRNWIRFLRSHLPRPASRPSLEQLDDRVVPTATLLKDNLFPAGSSGSGGFFTELTRVNDTLYFIGDDGVSGRELWKSDGTSAGTVRVKDINPGSKSSFPSDKFNLDFNNLWVFQFAQVNGTLYFTANDGVSGWELWKSNGTAAGTVRVKDINPGPLGSFPSDLFQVNGTLYFTANDGVSGGELWKSDGTAAGTIRVKDINPGPLGSTPTDLFQVNGTLYFTADDGDIGGDFDLWKSDGTSAGTVLVKDFGQAVQDGSPSGFTNVNGTLYFRASDGVSGSELWKSDGTAAGTVRVKDINPGSKDSFPSALINVNGTLYFTANDGVSGDELWKSNGLAAGTVRVKDINPGSKSSSPSEFTQVNGTFFFSANDGVSGDELWKSDGTAAGTVRVRDISPGSGSSSPRLLTNVNGTLYFSASDGANGREFWKSDGTDKGTQRVADILPGTGSSNPGHLTAVGDRLFFTAANSNNIRGLWVHNTKLTGPITDPNQAPSGADKTLTITEDQSYPLKAADFGFSDSKDNHQLLSVKIATLPAKGSLKLSGVALTAKNNTKEVTATQLASGALIYTPAANESGAKYASFSFQVRDNGGTAGGGKDLDPTPNTLLFQVNPVNDAPAGAGKILTINEDASHKFTLADFPFTDAEKHALAAVKISTLPAAAKGTLKLNGIALTAGKEVSAADLSKGLFTFTPAKDGNGKNFASFTFQVRDNGGTASGGIDLDPTPRALTIHVNAVNDAPIGSNRTITLNEDTAHKFALADFPFTDAEKHALASVKISTLPAAAKGTLKLNGIALTAGKEVIAADLSKGLFTFTPAKGGNGQNFASFTFQVRDNGGTASGGKDLDLTPRALTIHVNHNSTIPSTAPVSNIQAIPRAENVEHLTEDDGTPKNQSRVRVPFSHPIRLLDTRRFRLVAPVQDPALTGTRIVQIPILNASIDPLDSKILILETGQLVPKGANLQVPNNTLQTPKGQPLHSVKDLNILNSTISPTDFVLANRAFKPTNINRFTKDAFPKASVAPVPAAGNYTEQQATREITDFYNKAVGAGKMTPAERTQRIQQWNSTPAKAIVPDPKLRAGLFSLAGTSASAAIDSVLTSNNQSGKPYASINYDASAPDGAMKASANATGARIINVSNSFKGEPIEAIGANFAHEVMHQDNVNGQQEEVIADTARAMVWSEQLILNPSLATKNTLAVRTNNTLSLALLNSGNNGYPKVGITSAPQIQTGANPVKSKVFVGGSENFISLDNYIRTSASIAGVQDVDTVGNSYLTSFVSKVNKSNVSNNGFSRATRDSIDKNQLALSNTDALKLSNILKMTS